MYEQFAALYDALMDDVDYAAWARHYLTLIDRAGVTPRRVAECACGTGNLSIELSRMGAQVIASDLSEDMLRVAADKGRKAGVMIPWVRQDMRQLLVPRPVDAVIAACDGVNYLTGEPDVRAFFQAAFRALKPGGALCFDVSTRHKLESVLAGAFFGETREDMAYLWQNTYDAASAMLTMDVTFFARQEDGRYARFDELHRQRAHTEEELKAWLTRAGFWRIECFGENTLTPPAPDAQRIHIVAVKPA